MTKLRTATAKDFKIGTTLITKIGGWKFTLISQGSSEFWESTKKVHFVEEAKHYNVTT